MKVKVKEIQDWIDGQFKAIRLKAYPCDEKDIRGYKLMLKTLRHYLDDIDINYIDRRESRKRSIFEIANHFGVEYQCAKLEEELIECLHAIKRYNTRSIHNYNEEQLRKDLVEEIGDVRMMVMQVEYLLGIHEEVNDSINDKIIRTFNKINEEKSTIDLDKIREANA